MKLFERSGIGNHSLIRVAKGHPPPPVRLKLLCGHAVRLPPTPGRGGEGGEPPAVAPVLAAAPGGAYAYVPAEVDRAAASRLEELLVGDQPATEMGTRRARDAE